MRLTAPQEAMLRAALLDAFADRDALEQMVRFRLGWYWHPETAPDAVADAVDLLLDEARRRQQRRALARAAVLAQATHPGLRAFCATVAFPGNPAAWAYSNGPLSRPTPFVGRAAVLTQIETALATGPVVAVTGLPGSWTTTLAAEVAWRAHERQPYAGGIWWLAMADPAWVPAQVAALGGPLALPGWTSRTFPADLALVEAALADSTPRLLIFDGLADAATWERWRPPAGSGSRVLITSPTPAWLEAAAVPTFLLGPLTPAEGRDLLLQRAGHSAAPASALAVTAEVISTTLGGWPLALTLAAGALIAASDEAWTQYAEALLARLQAESAPPLGMISDLPPASAAGIKVAADLNWAGLDPATARGSQAHRLLAVAALSPRFTGVRHAAVSRAVQSLCQIPIAELVPSRSRP
jgi:hypothetical protein